MKNVLKLIAIAAAFGLAPGALAQPAEGTAQAAAGGANEQRAAPAAAQTAEPTPAITGAPSEAATASTANAPSAEQTDVPAWSSSLTPRAEIGQPDGRMGLQDQVTPIGREAQGFHDYILMPVITIISLLVLVLLAWVILRYRRAAHPVPSRTSHNTMIEVIWTLVPVVVLVIIAVPSIGLLSRQYSPPNADLTVKVTGHQWYWQYQYPDHGIDITSNMLPEAGEGQPGQRTRTDADGARLLAVDERMLVPVGATVKLIVTADPTGVIHAFGVPAFWVKMDAVPGRLNETWFRAEQPGIYYGQCYELCGSRHAYMPIAVEVVSQEDFDRWVASKGGTLPGAAPAASVTSNAASPAGATSTGNQTAPATQPDAPGVVQGTTTPQTSSQAATNPQGQ